jgi:hypothetical protein
VCILQFSCFMRVRIAYGGELDWCVTSRYNISPSRKNHQATAPNCHCSNSSSDSESIARSCTERNSNSEQLKKMRVFASFRVIGWYCGAAKGGGAPRRVVASPLCGAFQGEDC